jgi:hypothetical protein
MSSRDRWLALVMLVSLSVAACGGAGGSAAPSQGGGASSEPSQAAEPSEGGGSSSEPQPSTGGGGGGDLPEVGDITLQDGTLLVRVSGGASVAVEIPGSGFVMGGNVMLTGVADDGTANAQIVWSPSEGAGGLSFSKGDFATAADLVEQCSITLTKNDPTGLAGIVECKGIEAVTNGGLSVVTIDLRIEFAFGH